jgi:serine/threonine protein kinase
LGERVRRRQIAGPVLVEVESPMAVPQLAVVPRDTSPATEAQVDADRERNAIEAALRHQYTFIDCLGGGGMSRVYLARERGLDRLVAIKVLLPELCDRREDRERFRREARVLGSLRHPGIMPVFTLGDADGVPFFVMPFVDGPCLARRIANGARFTEREACALLAGLADAVAAAHRAGIIHRDIKPANVLLESGRPVLADFGVATLHTSEHSRSEAGRGFGTLAYMAPEQLLGHAESDERSDIYSLGIVAFELLAGRRPFTGDLGREVAAQHVARPAPRVSVFRPGVSPALDDLILRCMAKDPAERWQTASGLRDAVLAAAAARDARAARTWRSKLARLGRGGIGR